MSWVYSGDAACQSERSDSLALFVTLLTCQAAMSNASLWQVPDEPALMWVHAYCLRQHLNNSRKLGPYVNPCNRRRACRRAS